MLKSMSGEKAYEFESKYGPIRLVQAFLPQLLNQEESAIVNVSSGLAFFRFDETPIYSASKSALHFYTQSLRNQLKGTGVKVFELAPPKTSTPLFVYTEGHKGNKMPTLIVEDLVKAMIKGIQKDQFEIKPGLSKLLKIIGRFTV